MQRGLDGAHTERSIDTAADTLHSVATGDAASAAELTGLLNSAPARAAAAAAHLPDRQQQGCGSPGELVQAGRLLPPIGRCTAEWWLGQQRGGVVRLCKTLPLALQGRSTRARPARRQWPARWSPSAARSSTRSSLPAWPHTRRAWLPAWTQLWPGAPRAACALAVRPALPAACASSGCCPPAEQALLRRCGCLLAVRTSRLTGSLDRGAQAGAVLALSTPSPALARDACGTSPGSPLMRAQLSWLAPGTAKPSCRPA